MKTLIKRGLNTQKKNTHTHTILFIKFAIITELLVLKVVSNNPTNLNDIITICKVHFAIIVNFVMFKITY